MKGINVETKKKINGIPKIMLMWLKWKKRQMSSLGGARGTIVFHFV